MRFWIIELPALIVDLFFRAYMVCLAALTMISFGMILFLIARAFWTGLLP